MNPSTRRSHVSHRTCLECGAHRVVAEDLAVGDDECPVCGYVGWAETSLRFGLARLLRAIDLELGLRAPAAERAAEASPHAH